MFSATVSGTVQRVIHDNNKSGKDAMIKVVLAVSKRFAKDPKESKIFPLFTIWGFDADYMRKYVGVGQPVAFMDCEMEAFKNDKKLDEDGNPIEQISYRVGKASYFKADILKALVAEGVAEEAEGGDEEEEDDRSSRRKKSSSSRDRKSSSSRSARRGRRDEDEDEDEDEEEEERPARRKSSSSARDKKKTSTGRKPSSRRARDEDEDDDDDDDNYFDED